MKIAISIPDEVFEDARLARRTRKSRSQLFSDAIREYIARHGREEITEAMDEALAALGQPTDEFISTASRRSLARSEW